MHPSAKDIVDLYERHAHNYDGDRGRVLMERAWLDRFRAVIAPDMPILDIGCGCGEPIAQYLIESGHAVTGVDSSPSLVELCRQRFPAHTWVVGDMRRLDLGTRFGGLIAWDSFFHLSPDDQRGMFAIFRALAADGAALMFTSGPSHGEAIGSYHGEPLYHASLDPAEYKALLAAHDFAVIEHVVEDPACGGHTIWLARLVASHEGA